LETERRGGQRHANIFRHEKVVIDELSVQPYPNTILKHNPNHKMFKSPSTDKKPKTSEISKISLAIPLPS